MTTADPQGNTRQGATSADRRQIDVRRNAARRALVKIDQAAIARALRTPNPAALYSDAVELAHRHFERRKARQMLSDASLVVRILRE
ncbi:hypothetical protein G3480_25040 [Thiorhodococcus mannitoliphagus]|uniref:Uncharacterized protein n=1 Tax=Thiorhodococcus mannitoliphagus TaxID=329406 RepID=A0A6P1DYV3_9GAMM|nr:hypothetical protein [Thiorhodococcus mannitoliphagus]NEX23507.1 hypothetical protein [Thiorhodococcus mannitoliphagus]